MIISFDCKETEKVSLGIYSKKWGESVRKSAMIRLDYLSSAVDLNDLRIPPSNRLHVLKDDLKGFYSISINKQWRLIFMWNNGNASNVKIIDYH
ncbi:MAG: type II toxin-antitoxin system RelE/ParE family toxin [Cyclobacteriaceae bacterium]|nr:type II toxin-antitoxin system RelE/ParE family toxin [Cyclobacteriaceae bacterium]